MIESLLAAAPEGTTASFFRTAAGAEIDLLLELRADHGLWAIEIKRGLAVRPGRGFHLARADVQPERSFLVYAGEDRFPVSKDVEVIGVHELAALLAEMAP